MTELAFRRGSPKPSSGGDLLALRRTDFGGLRLALLVVHERLDVRVCPYRKWPAEKPRHDQRGEPAESDERDEHHDQEELDRPGRAVRRAVAEACRKRPRPADLEPGPESGEP